jgi:hypothetical protein
LAALATVAESCQFAPTPIGQGFVLEEAQDAFAMLTVAVCVEVLDEEEPPQPARAKSEREIKLHDKNRMLRICTDHRRLWD